MKYMNLRTTAIAISIMMCLVGTVFAEGMIALPKHPAKIKTDLFTALAERRSTDTFASTAISRDQLSALLWAANGVNRKDGKRTAPSAMDTRCITLYYAGAEGAYRYDATQHALQLITTADIRANIAKQDFVGKAPCVLILTADISKYPPYAGNKNDRLMASQASAGFVGQNIYLTAAALKLGTRYIMYIKPKDIQKALRLNKNEEPLAVMPVGVL